MAVDDPNYQGPCWDAPYCPLCGRGTSDIAANGHAEDCNPDYDPPQTREEIEEYIGFGARERALLAELNRLKDELAFTKNTLIAERNEALRQSLRAASGESQATEIARLRRALEDISQCGEYLICECARIAEETLSDAPSTGAKAQGGRDD